MTDYTIPKELMNYLNQCAYDGCKIADNLYDKYKNYIEE
jgi:hypothetical protein